MCVCRWLQKLSQRNLQRPDTPAVQTLEHQVRVLLRLTVRGSAFRFLRNSPFLEGVKIQIRRLSPRETPSRTSSVKMPRMVGCEPVFSPSRNVFAEKQRLYLLFSIAWHSLSVAGGPFPAARACFSVHPHHRHHLQHACKTTAGKTGREGGAGKPSDRNAHRHR